MKQSVHSRGWRSKFYTRNRRWHHWQDQFGHKTISKQLSFPLLKSSTLSKASPSGKGNASWMRGQSEPSSPFPSQSHFYLFFFCTFQASMTCAFLSVTLNVSSLSKEGAFGFCVHPLPISTGARCRCLRDVCRIKQNELLKLQKRTNVADVLTGDQHTGWRQMQCQNHWGACFQS